MTEATRPTAPLMHAAVLHAAGDLRYEAVPVPMPGPMESLVRIRANGICGSDIHFYESGRLGPFVVDRPYIPGHEAVGEIVAFGESGADGGRLAVGARVVIEPGVPCRRCSSCRRGLYNLCRDVVFLSAPPVDGTFAEYISHASDFLYPVPDSLDDETAALVEPVSVGVHACNRAALTAGSSVAIVGAGPIGLITLLVARAYGAGRCVVIDVDANRLEAAKRLGADEIVLAGDEDVTTAACIEASRGGAEFVFDASGSSAGCVVAVRIARSAGVVTIIGWPERPRFDYPVELIIERELDVRGINRYRNTYPTAIELMARGAIDVKPLVTHRFGFDRVVEAFTFASTHRRETVKVVVVNS